MLLPDLKIIILVVAVATNILLLVTVYKQNSRSATNKFFAVFCFVASLWLIAAYRSATPVTDLEWSRLTIFLASLMMSFFFLFAHTMPYRYVRLPRKNIFILFLSTGVVMLLALGQYVFPGVYLENGILRLAVGPGMALFGILATTLSLGAIYVLWKKIAIATGVEKEQIRFVMTGAILMLISLITTVMLPVIISGNDRFVPFIPIYVLLFLGMSAYAIVRYRFLDIRAVIARAVAFVFLLLTVAAAYAAALFTGLQKALHVTIDAQLFIAICVLTIFAIFAFQPIETFIRKLTNKLFFHDLYDSDELLSIITRIMVEEVEVGPLILKILGILKNKLHIDHSGILLLSVSDALEWHALGFAEGYPPEIMGHGVYEVLTDVTCVYDELPPGLIRDIFARHYIAATFPIKLQGRTIAIFILGHKLSGEPFSESDVLFLELLSSEMAIGIQNAKSFSEILHFNEKLEENVSQRTRELELSQKEELAKAQEVSRLKDEFVFLASHELRTPITAIRGFLELTFDTKVKFPKDIQQNLEAISQASDHLNQLVNDLLEIARSEGGKLPIEAKANDLHAPLEEVLHEIVPLMKEKSITLHKDIKEIPNVFCDPMKVKEVLLNLMGNAIKYGRQGGNIYLSVYHPPEDGYVLIEVRDDGFGIPDVQQEKIFQKFFRAGTRGTERVMGTGLGLFITRMLVERMGGEIMFTSNEQHGSTFSFTLPIAK